MCKVKVGVQYFEDSIYFLIKIYIQMHVEDGFNKFFCVVSLNNLVILYTCLPFRTITNIKLLH